LPGANVPIKKILLFADHVLGGIVLQSRNLTKDFKVLRLLQIVIILAASGCVIKSKPAQTQTQEHQATGPINFIAIATDPSGNVLNGVEVYFHRERMPVAVSDALGRINFTVPRSVLIDRASRSTDPKQQVQTPEASFHLTFMSASMPGYGLISKDFSFNQEGNLDLGTVVLQELTDLKGVALELSESYQMSPAVAAEISLNSHKATTNEKGEFVLEGVPNGRLSLKIIDFQGTQHFAEATATKQQSNLQNPLVLFNESKVQGALFPFLTIGGVGTFTNTPLLMNFELKASRRALKMRFHHSREEILKGAFQPFLPFFSYTFPSAGVQQLYLQLADESEKELSEILSTRVSIGVPIGDQTIVIGDGSGVIPSKKTSLHFRIPAGTITMKVAEIEGDLAIGGSAQWRTPQELIDFVFTSVTTSGRVQVFVLFGLDNGKTETYSQNALFMPFPPANEPVFMINGGGTETTDRVVRLDIKIPPNALQMRVTSSVLQDGSGNSTSISGGGISGSIIIEDGAGGMEQRWLNVSPIHFKVFIIGGLKTVTVSFRDVDNIESPTYTRIIRVNPFPPQPFGFVIGDGSGISSLPDVNIALIPPYGAVSYRIWNGTASTGSQGMQGMEGMQGMQGMHSSPSEWSVIVPNFRYIIGGTGPQMLEVQYRNVDGVASPTFTNVVNLNLFPEPTLVGIISDGSATTTSQNIQIKFPAVPVAAVAVRISENLEGLSNLPALTLAGPVLFRLSDGLGVKIVHFQFVSVNGAASTVFSDSIELQ
jgi:hypothetical protein